MKAKYKTCKEYMDSKLIPIDLMSEFTDYLNWLAEDPLSRIYNDSDLKKFLFEEFVGGLAKRLSLIRELEEEVNI